MASYEAVRGMPVSPIESPRGSLEQGRDALPRYEALSSDETEAKPYSEIAIDPLPPSMPISSKPRTRSQHLCDRIGHSGLLVLVLGSVVILVSSTVLIFLWAGAEQARNRRRQPKFWYDLVSRDWSTRIVTICSALVRISLAFQIGFVTAAISAVMLEESGCRFRDIAALSIQRALCTNASPSNVLPGALRQCITNGLYGFCYLWILSNAFAIAIVSTFTSTILLSDFGTAHITAPSITETIPIGINSSSYDRFNELDVGIPSCFRSRPSAHWRFAEANMSQTSSAKFGDTGDVYRAFIPFSSPEVRASLEYYSGPALVNNHRTVCIGPEMDGIRLNYTLPDPLASSNSLTSFNFRADLSARKYGELVQLPGDTTKSPVARCSLYSIWHGDTDWPFSTCQMRVGETDEILTSVPAKDKRSRIEYFFYPIMLVNASTSLKTFYETGSYDESLRNLSTTTGDVWTKVYSANGTQLLSATVCFVNTEPMPILNITMTGWPISSEPAVDWHRLSTKENKTGHLQQIGTGLPADYFARRGILELDFQTGNIPKEKAKQNDGVNFLEHQRLLLQALREDNDPGSWNLATNITEPGIYPWTAHPEHSALVQKVLKLTQDPAQAIHALVFHFSQMIYYAHQPRFNIKRHATTINTSEMLLPIQWTGLSVVVATITVHFSVLLVTTVFFVVWTKASLLGNAWQAVSQIVSPQTREVMDTLSVDTMRDKDVEGWARATGRNSQVYSLSRSNDQGRTEIRLH